MKIQKIETTLVYKNEFNFVGYIFFHSYRNDHFWFGVYWENEFN